ncbi:MAG: hypothetical protein ACXWJW_03685 [Xanthobacteraceae bacterium]
MRGLVFVALSATALVTGALQALAESGPVCDAYVNEALKGAKDVRKMACFDSNGVKNPRWSFDPTVHRRWCLTVSSEDLAKERDERAKELDHCGYCRDYAHRAYQSAMFNKEHKCGFTGPRWDTEEQNHFNWCMGLGMDTAYMLFVLIPVETLADNYGESKLFPEEDARDEAIGECVTTKHIDQPLTAMPSLRPKISVSKSKIFIPVLRNAASRTIPVRPAPRAR